MVAYNQLANALSEVINEAVQNTLEEKGSTADWDTKAEEALGRALEQQDWTLLVDDDGVRDALTTAAEKAVSEAKDELDLEQQVEDAAENYDWGKHVERAVQEVLENSHKARQLLSDEVQSLLEATDFSSLVAEAMTQTVDFNHYTAQTVVVAELRKELQRLRNDLDYLQCVERQREVERLALLNRPGWLTRLWRFFTRR